MGDKTPDYMLYEDQSMYSYNSMHALWVLLDLQINVFHVRKQIDLANQG